MKIPFLTKANRLVVEHVVTYKQKLLNFKVYDADKMTASVECKLTGDKDVDRIRDIYTNLLTSNGLKNFEECDLILSTFDTVVENMRLKASLFSPSNLLTNFIIDTFGVDYKNKYMLKVVKTHIDGGYLLNSCFACPLSHVEESEIILSGLGIKRFRVTFLGQYINNYFASYAKLSHTYLYYDAGAYGLLACVIKNQIFKNVFLPKDDINIGQYPMNLVDLKNALISLHHKMLKDEYVVDGLTILGQENKKDELVDLDLQIDNIPLRNHSDLFIKPIEDSYKPMVKKEEKQEKKKSGFDWQKFLGIKKKGFTLIESAVSIAIFAVIATLTTTFIVTATNVNADSKRSVLATSYLKSVSEVFEGDPSEANVRDFTKFEGEDIFTGQHEYYLNQQMDFYLASANSTNMTYRVLFNYSLFSYEQDENIAQKYSKYVFTVVAIHTINGTKSYGDSSFTVVR